jgi:hypothetical protein
MPPSAKAPSGGTRTYGERLTALMPAHAVGTYYYLLCSRRAESRVRILLDSPFAQ